MPTIIKSTKRQFKVVKAMSLEELEDTVEFFLNRGWEISGGMTIHEYKHAGIHYFLPLTKTINVGQENS